MEVAHKNNLILTSTFLFFTEQRKSLKSKFLSNVQGSLIKKPLRNGKKKNILSIKK